MTPLVPALKLVGDGHLALFVEAVAMLEVHIPLVE
jgi:hypothetical protein